MRKFNLLLALALLALTLAACTTGGDDKDNGNGTPGTADSMFARINDVRSDNGQDELSQNDILEQIAEEQASINAQQGFNSDSDGDGVTVAERLGDAGYNYSVVAYLFNNGTEQRSFDEWVGNPAYSGVLLSEDYDELGVGVASGATQQWWVAIFASSQAPTSDTAQQMLALLNEFRMDNGADPLTLDTDLSIVAQQQATYNAAQGQNLAVNGDGETLAALSEDAGYEGALVMWTLSSGAAADSLERWTDTAEETALMLDDRLVNVGIGAAPGNAQQWWVVIYTSAPTTP